MRVVKAAEDTHCRDCRRDIPAGAECVEDRIGRNAANPRIICMRCASN